MRLSPSTDTLRRNRGRRRGRLFLFLVLLVAIGLGALGAFRVGPAPTIEIRPALPAIGRSTPVEVALAEPRRGLSEIRIELVQNGTVTPLVSESFAPLAPWKLWGARTPEHIFLLAVGKQDQEALVEGEATIRVTAEPAPAWLRGGTPATDEVTLPVRLTPPAVQIESSQHYVAQGGCEAVVYRVGATAVRDGVEVGERFFPGFQVPGGLAGDHFALFAIPYDQGDASNVHVIAEDEVGNRRSTAFVDRFFPQPPRTDDIVLSDAFLERVVPAILENTPGLDAGGTLIEKYLVINRELRRRNAEELAALAPRSTAAFLWSAPFLALPGGQVMSSFADHRTYYYGGEEVDRQDHLGFDLASVAHADVPAANSGTVVLARFLGIYGNAVVVDHGFGLMSLYAHLSSIAVSEGDDVKRGQVLGRSGATGLAGGDHLHFSFLLQGLPVRPAEWWDAHWIEDRLKRKLGDALPFGGRATPER